MGDRSDSLIREDISYFHHSSTSRNTVVPRLWALGCVEVGALITLGDGFSVPIVFSLRRPRQPGAPQVSCIPTISIKMLAMFGEAYRLSLICMYICETVLCVFSQQFPVGWGSPRQWGKSTRILHVRHNLLSFRSSPVGSSDGIFAFRHFSSRSILPDPVSRDC